MPTNTTQRVKQVKACTFQIAHVGVDMHWFI